MASLRPHCRKSRGQALVEFALVTPLLTMLLFGIFDLGRAIYAYSTIANAARVGARVASVNQILSSPDCSEQKPVEDPSSPHWSIETCAADSAISLGVQPGDVSVGYSAPSGTTLSCTGGALDVGCIASVTVHYTFTPVTPVIGNLVGSVHMDSTSQMPIERVFP